MLVPPAGQRVVDIDQFLGQLVEFEIFLRIAIDREPRGLDLVRPFNREAGAGERGIGLIPQRRLIERGAEPGLRDGIASMIFEKLRVLDPEPILKLAKLDRLEPRRGAQHIAKRAVIDRGERRQHIPRHGHHRLDPADPRQGLIGFGVAVPGHQPGRQRDLVEHLLEPQFLGLVDDDEQHFVMQPGSRALGTEQIV